MSSDIIVAMISTAGLIIVAVLNLRTSRRVKVIQGQVQNSHSTNLREELDERHTETRSTLGDIRKDIGGLRSEMRAERAERLLLSTKLHNLEQKDTP